ncbi:MAG TPA: aspartate kinase [Bacteroidota bacterium]|nr:aspartate kinase [Bacteroidota bacterium]
MKFGGTSNEDAVAMRNVIRIVKEHVSQRPVVVISAIARATNELEQTARTAATGDERGAVAIVTKLFERHNAILDNLLNDRRRAAELEEIFFHHLSDIKTIVKGVAILRELTPRTMDAICSYGERLSSRIIAAGLQEAGVDAVWVDACEFMITDDNFGGARPVMELVTEHLEQKVRPLLNAGKVPVTQGFIGITRSGEYTTMGRESSDYSASLIGGAMHAQKVQIWTDVDGILTADPRVVRSVKKLKRMSFEEAFELSYFGAKVLHPRTMLPVIEKNIPVQILNSKRVGTGTLVDFHSEDSDGAEALVKSIAHKSNVAVVAITPRQRHGQYLFWEGIFNVLTGHNISTGISTTSEYALAFSTDALLITDNVLDELGRFGVVEVIRNQGSICLVGKGLRRSTNVLPRIFRALEGIEISMVSFGASGVNVTLVVDGARVHEAVNRLHQEFFEQAQLPDLFEDIYQA